MKSKNRLTLDQLRRYAVRRTLFAPTTLARAIAKLGFVQADPIRAPARAQDLTLRHRVKNYRAGDLERHYPNLAIEEDYFVNYGFLAREHHRLMHPRKPRRVWSKARRARAQTVLEFVRDRGTAHPREVDAHFNHGKTKNWFGGSSRASTQLLDGMHYRGLLRVARRDNGIRVYAARVADKAPPDKTTAQNRLDALVDLIAHKYAPLPAASLGQLVSYLRLAAPQWAADRKRALAHAKQRLATARVDGIDWYWPAEEDPRSARHRCDDRVRLLAPFDPIVWDRRRFELFWGWAFRFEAYLPAPKRVRGYYALPMLWGEEVIGWCNVSVVNGQMQVDPGFAKHRPRSVAFKTALDDELRRLRDFLGL